MLSPIERDAASGSERQYRSIRRPAVIIAVMTVFILPRRSRTRYHLYPSGGIDRIGRGEPEGWSGILSSWLDLEEDAVSAPFQPEYGFPRRYSRRRPFPLGDKSRLPCPSPLHLHLETEFGVKVR